MELNKYELSDLAKLWLASEHNQEFKIAIENELKDRISKNNRFSREYLFDICKIKKHSMGVLFIPSTQAFNDFGQHINIDIILNTTEIEEMITNIIAKPPISTFGQIKATLLITSDLSPEQLELLENKGFHTNEILDVQPR